MPARGSQPNRAQAWSVAIPGALAAWMVEAQNSAPVTQWPARLALTALVVGAMALAVWGMAVGWRRRGARQMHLPMPATMPVDPGADRTGGEVPGRYFGTSSAKSWLDRIVAHGLGATGRAGCTVFERGIWIDRDGAAALWIEADQIAEVDVDRGVAGQIAEKDGLLVITWTPGTTVASGEAMSGPGRGRIQDQQGDPSQDQTRERIWWETGFRPDTTQGLATLLRATVDYRDSGAMK